jgi:RNA polymerase sigma-70 factor (ECF subfamily)
VNQPHALVAAWEPFTAHDGTYVRHTVVQRREQRSDHTSNQQAGRPRRAVPVRMDMTAPELAVVHRGDEVQAADREVSLVHAAQRGSVQAFEALVTMHGATLHRFLVLRLGNDADAKDALQDTLIAAWRGLASLRDPRSLRAWLLTLATRQASRMSAGRRPHSTLDDGAAAAEPAAAGDLRRALEALAPERRDVVLLRYLVGLSERETAEVLGVSVGTVKSRAARARLTIGAHLQGEEEQS